MNLQAFRQTLQMGAPPEELSLHQKALWYDARNNWQQAHELIQDETDQLSSRIHAYLHRKEGDTFNAGYWYRRAGCRQESGSLQQEWDALAIACCSPA